MESTVDSQQSTDGRLKAWFNGAMLQAVTIREIERIFEITDRLGIHRESVVIPLGPRHPGRVRRMPNGKIEIVVEAEGEFEDWLAGLEAELRKLAGPAGF
jgi:hypothetical protein